MARPLPHLVLLTLLVLPLACHDPAPGGTQVEVNSALQPGVDVDRVDVIARVASDGTPLSTVTAEGGELHFPLTVNFVSGKSTAAGTELQVTANASFKGETVASAAGKATLEAEHGSTLKLTLVAGQRPVQPGVKELCDNGVDDDGDGAADCADTDCDTKGCQAGGLTCIARRCGCAGGVVGVAVESAATFEKRMEPQAVVLADGMLATVGGRDGAGTLSGTVEFYANGTLVTRPLPAPRAGPEVLALPDGGMVVAFGRDAADAPLSSLDVLTATREFTTSAVAPAVHCSKAGVGQLAGGLLVAGGELALDGAATTAANTWARMELASDVGHRTASGELSGVRGRALAPLGDELLTVGGPEGSPSAGTDLLSADGTARPGPTLPLALSGAVAVRLADGRVMVLGGSNAQGQPSGRVFIFRSRAGDVDMREVGALAVPKSKPRAALAPNGWVYVDDATGFAAAPEWFDPVGERFVPGNSPERRGYAVAGPYSNGVALTGGGPGGVPDGKIVVLTPACP